MCELHLGEVESIGSAEDGSSEGRGSEALDSGGARAGRGELLTPVGRVQRRQLANEGAHVRFKRRVHARIPSLVGGDVKLDAPVAEVGKRQYASFPAALTSVRRPSAMGLAVPLLGCVDHAHRGGYGFAPDRSLDVARRPRDRRRASQRVGPAHAGNLHLLQPRQVLGQDG